jgi:putative mRNA 3-end processing factor
MMVNQGYSELIVFTNKGAYCPPGDFYIDPVRQVEKAIITHAHSDHARNGMKHYLSHHDNYPLLQSRLSRDISFQGLHYGETLKIGDVSIRLLPAGHIAGSALIMLEYKGYRLLYSGDYKTESDGFCTPLQLETCHTFITESTFGLPIFRWESQETVFRELRHWINQCFSDGLSVVLWAYSLGKAQRLLHHLREFEQHTYLHDSIHKMNLCLKEAGYPMGEHYKPIREQPKQPSLLLAPPSSSVLLSEILPNGYRTAMVSGWMRVRKHTQKMTTDRGFVLSDHCDWDGLIASIQSTEAQHIMAHHGFSSVLSEYVSREMGLIGTDIGQLRPILH